MSDIDIGLMRISGRILAETLKFLTEEYIKPGVSTLDISNKAEEIIRSHTGAVPAFLGYHGFPGSACVSVNEQVVHGIPSQLVVTTGDIVSIDCGVIYEKHFSDACRTIGVEHIDPKLSKLLEVTKDSLDKGIEQARVGNRISDISYAIQRHVERNSFNVSLEFVGHGIGRVLHGPPCVPSYGAPNCGPEIKPGTCLAIEPVVFDGSPNAVLAADGWSVSSRHGNMSAHFEDTIVITEDGPEILTR
jgi:methionyl aminopeptidase